MCFLVIWLADILLVFQGFWLQSVFCKWAQNRLKFIGQCLCCFLQKSDGGLPCLIFMMLSVWLFFSKCFLPIMVKGSCCFGVPFWLYRLGLFGGASHVKFANIPRRVSQYPNPSRQSTHTEWLISMQIARIFVSF